MNMIGTLSMEFYCLALCNNVSFLCARGNGIEKRGFKISVELLLFFFFVQSLGRKKSINMF